MPRMSSAPCPRCGSSDARPITPNLRECQGQVLYNVIPAGAQGNVSDVLLYRRCGHRYQVASPMGGAPPASCEYGMYSVGACTACARPLCGDHIVIRDGRVLCAADAAAVARAAEEAEAARLQRARAARLQQIETWERQAAAALATVTDPTERAVRIFAAQLPRVLTTELADMVPATRPPVPEIAVWFLRVVTAPPSPLGVYEPHWLTGNPKYRERPGWRFGSICRRPRPRGESEFGSITVLADGRIFYNDRPAPRPDEHFNSSALASMVAMSSVRPLGLLPRPWHWEEHIQNGGYRTDAEGLRIP